MDLRMNMLDSAIYASIKDGWVPQVGMVFPSEGIAYEFYNLYAGRVGFTVRLGKVERLKDGTIRKRIFLCNKQGQPETCRKRGNDDHQENDQERINTNRERGEKRTDCKARMCIKFEKDNTWVLSEIICEHNHPLATQGGMVGKIDDTEIRNADCFENVRTEARGNGSLDFVGVDVNHLQTKRMRSLKEGDTQILLDYFKRMQLDNPSFFYSIQVDKDDRMTNFFWADSRSMINYSYFGDVVCFDTGYLTKNYGLPFAPFIGVNHHKQIILFGAAILLDETTNSFVWLFETWMKAMFGRQPKTILTDQCAEIENAIAMVLPETHHRLCLWQISQNAAKHISHVYTNEPNFQHEFHNCIYGYDTEEGFHTGWDIMLNKYNLVGNNWLEGLYDVREKWALAYGRDIFCADMTTTQQKESMNELFQKYLDRNLPLSKFVNCYQQALVNQFEKEQHEDSISKQTEPTLCVEVPMLKQAANEYTRKVFEIFQEEYKSWPCCNVENCGENGTIYIYKVSQFGQHRECLVTFDSSDVTVVCSCKKFELMGIFCRHIMKVLNQRNIFEIPTQYILKRWTKKAKTQVTRDNGEAMVQPNSPALLALRYSELCDKAISIAAKGVLSEGAHFVATRGLDKLLEEAEDALKTEGAENLQTTPSLNPEQEIRKTGQTDQVLAEGRSKEPPADPNFHRRNVGPRLSTLRPRYPMN